MARRVPARKQAFSIGEDRSSAGPAPVLKLLLPTVALPSATWPAVMFQKTLPPIVAGALAPPTELSLRSSVGGPPVALLMNTFPLIDRLVLA